ncbi:MAG: hypothetical protein JXD23_07740 [Spirochaetales bacterium]|nr:hypothetical protein [Spirochaetales bacterium]
MGKYEELAEARALFGIEEEETMAVVKRKINALLKKWHPDTGSGKEGDGARNAKTAALVGAKKIIMKYCEGYRISFGREDVERYLSPEERWKRNFGGDHVWGGNG